MIIFVILIYNTWHITINNDTDATAMFDGHQDMEDTKDTKYIKSCVKGISHLPM